MSSKLNLELNKVKPNWFCTLAVAIVFLIYSLSLKRDWQYFDERIVYNEGLFPVPHSLHDLFEIIKTYTFTYNLDSQNALFSNIITLRSNLFGAILNIIISYLFNKNNFFYHILQVLIHLTNTLFAWLILYKLLKLKNLNSSICSFTATFLSLLWALHPANVETVLLVTNWPSLFTYTFCFSFLLHIITKIENGSYKNSIKEGTLLTLLSFIAMLISEYCYIIFAILFFISLALICPKQSSARKAFVSSLELVFPYILGLVLFVSYYIFRAFTLGIESYLSQGSFSTSLERILWISPQIFLHFIKLFFFPKALSIFQSILLELSSFYPILALSLLILLIAFPAALVFLNRRFIPVIFVYGLLFSLFPFLQIISPGYCLIAERYCYFPLFILLLTVCQLISKQNKVIILIFSVIILIFGIRTTYRILDWKDSYTLYNSALHASEKKLYKGQVHSVLGYYFTSIDKKKMNKHMKLSIKYLKDAIAELDTNKNGRVSNILKLYGLDRESLITTAAFTIASIKFEDFKESPQEILDFYEPYLNQSLESTGNSQLNLYSKLLIATSQEKKAINILESARKRYPTSPFLIYTLSNLYLKNKDIINAERIISEGYLLYPSNKRMLLRMIKLCELKNDQLNLAKYEYLLGLRTHSQVAYQRAAQIYLFLNRPNEAKFIIDKLLTLDKGNVITLLLLSKYFHQKKI
ncbi:MAG: hypothetical protein HYY52_01560 [Candidatus Melainabacteria bacterium]|nr:hypothetical protein [Candidatus Melainabacteria bacterium]